MDEQILEEKKPGGRQITYLAGGCLTILYLILCVSIVILGRRQITERNSPTPTPAITPTPHILVQPPANQTIITHDDLSSNRYNWGLYFHYGKIEIINGKLILQSNIVNGYAIGTSGQLSPISEKYYIQADLSTDLDTDRSYGLVFGLNRTLATYYMFEIQPRGKGFRLFKYNAGKWTELIPFTQVEIKPYPEATTLGVHFNSGQMELFINGLMVSEYSDKDYFQSKDFGVFVSNTGYRLIVDDIFTYDEK